jgi:hypothetical protein
LCSVARFLDAARIVVGCFVTSAWMLAATRAGAQTADTAPSGIVSAPPSGTLAPATALVPTTVPKATTAPTPTPIAVVAPSPSPKSGQDELRNAGYIPGYRLDPNLGMSPYSPRTPGSPGGVTPGYGAPGPSTDWTFRWSGFFTASLQTSENQRVDPAPGQSKTVFHVPPQTIDEYASFVGTSTMPGEWAQMNFIYGNPYVSANVSLTTWNPTDASTYYQIGSEQFINNFYLAYNPPSIGGVKLHALVGYFYNIYGTIGQYGLGMYTNAIVGGVRGVGEDLVAEYDLSRKITVTAEDGIMGNRNGMGPIDIVPTGQNGQGPIIWPSSWIHHAHVGIEARGDLTLRARLHYITNWEQDDRLQVAVADPQLRQIDTAYVKDGDIRVYGADAALISPILGYLGAAVSYTRGDNAYPVKGAITFGGDGASLTNRWWGQNTEGTGQLIAAGVNYSASLGRILSYPVPFGSDGPDLALNAGFIFADSWSDFQPFDARKRYKGGADLLYTFLPFMGVGFRADAVVPNSHDSEETFYVIAPRLVFKSDWNSRDTVTILYGKWFYGPHSHPEASSIVSGDRLDNQLFAINAQIFW